MGLYVSLHVTDGKSRWRGQKVLGCQTNALSQADFVNGGYEDRRVIC